jgi:hypothetical protein
MNEFVWRMEAEGKLKPGYRARRRASSKEEAGHEAEAGARAEEGATESVRVEAEAVEAVEAGAEAEEHTPSEGWQAKLIAWYRDGMPRADGAGGAEGGHHSRRRLSNHDEWGGVQLSLRLGRFANVYTQGHKMTIFDVIAAIGGASGSLIGLIGMGIASVEVFNSLRGKGKEDKMPQTGTSLYDHESNAA